MERLLFTKEEWEAVLPDVVGQMQAYLSDFCTPIAKHLGEYAELEGSGTYITLADRTFILTNEHVARVRSATQALIHMLRDKGELPLILGNHMAIPEPRDIALLPVSSTVWSAGDHRSRAITVDMIAREHRPVPTEVLIFVGYSGERHSFRFDTLITPATTSASREVPLPTDDDRFDLCYHFGLDYKPNLATSIEGTSGLPVPPGLSGSLVWNTRFVECRIRGEPWTPECARITGIVWGWPSNVGCLVATRAEYVVAVLDDAASRIRSGDLDT